MTDAMIEGKLLVFSPSSVNPLNPTVFIRYGSFPHDFPIILKNVLHKF